MKNLLGFVLATFVLSACGGGGGGGSSSVPGTSKTQAKIVNGSVVISIPNGTGQTPSSRARYPQFVSPNASSVAMNVNGGSDTFFDVSTNSSLCVTVPGTGRNCTLAFGAPVGSDTFGFLIFSGPNGSGQQLASATSVQTIAAATAFDFTVAMNAAVGVIVLGFDPSNGGGTCPDSPNGYNGLVEGCIGSGPVSVTVDDPSGAPITGSAPFATPLQLTTTEPTITVTPTTMTTPGQTVTIAYAGAPWQNATTSATLTVTAGGQAGSLTLPARQSNLYVANSNGTPFTTPLGGGNIAVYRYGATTPVRTLTGGLTNPETPKLDANGNLYVLDNGPYTTNSNPYINVYAPGASGSATPIHQITGIVNVDGNRACESMTFDPTGNYLLVICDDALIHVFSVPVAAIATATSLQTATLGSDDFSAPVSAVFDGSGGLYVTDPGENAIYYFSAAQITPTVSNGSMLPSNQMGPTTGWPATGIAPLGVTMDNAGNLFSTISYFAAAPGGAPDAFNEVAVWSGGILTCSNCAPTTTFTGTPFTVHASAGGALDPPGNLYIGNPFTNQINVFARATVNVTGVVNNPAVLRTINTGASPGAPIGLTVGP